VYPAVLLIHFISTAVILVASLALTVQVLYCCYSSGVPCFNSVSFATAVTLVASLALTVQVLYCCYSSGVPCFNSPSFATAVILVASLALTVQVSLPHNKTGRG
jgi:hypothetical protein